MRKIRAAAAWMLRVIGLLLLAGGLYWLIGWLSEPGTAVEPMEIIFIGTEDDADCTLLINRDKTVMIDTGEAQDYEAISQTLKAYGISRIDCLILTHPDKDHIGNALEILKNYSVSQVVEPYYDLENDRYEAVNDWIEAERVSCLIPTRERKLILGDMRLTVYPPEKFSYDNDNNYSLAVHVSHGNTQLFFAGDAMRKRTEELLELSVENVDLYKMSYHGRGYDGVEALLEKMSPDIVVVTARQAEPEGEELLAGYQVYYTVNAGAWFVSDGERLEEGDGLFFQP